MKTYMLPDVERYRRMTTPELRSTFLIENLFEKGKIVTNYIDLDRTIVGSAVPLREELTLQAGDELRAAYFLERREMGVLNIGGKGKVTVDGNAYDMDTLDCLYIGRGAKDVRFSTDSPSASAEFYLLSYPAHAAHPTTVAKKAQATVVPVGTAEAMNKRSINKYIHTDGIKSCQLVMGITQLDPGSGWNSMPPHTHARRSEVYLYFNLPPDARVFHMMGTPDETRLLLVADKQAIISPCWSIHCGVGTRNYTFCWAMGGENQVFDDMDAVKITDLR